MNLPSFYLRYYVGHKGKFGHEFLEYEVRPAGLLRYANNSNYGNDRLIRRQVVVSAAVLEELASIIRNSGLLQSSLALSSDPRSQGPSDGNYRHHYCHHYCSSHADPSLQFVPSAWPPPDRNGRQELELVVDGRHLRLATCNLGSLSQVQAARDPGSLQLFYHLVQDLKALVLSLISMHFKVKPIMP